MASFVDISRRFEARQTHINAAEGARSIHYTRSSCHRFASEKDLVDRETNLRRPLEEGTRQKLYAKDSKISLNRRNRSPTSVVLSFSNFSRSSILSLSRTRSTKSSRIENATVVDIVGGVAIHGENSNRKDITYAPNRKLLRVPHTFPGTGHATRDTLSVEQNASSCKNDANILEPSIGPS